MSQFLREKLKSIAEILHSSVGANSALCLEQVCYLIFLKILDERASVSENLSSTSHEARCENRRQIYPRQSERYRWSRWRTKSGVELLSFIGNQVFSYMASLTNDDSQIGDFFRDSVLEIDDPELLKRLVGEIDSISFTLLHKEIDLDFIESLISLLRGQEDQSLDFITPRHIRTMMVEMVDPEYGDSIYDPACGTGGFLTDSVEYILAKHSASPIEHPIYGKDWLDEREQTTIEAKKDLPTLQTYRSGLGEKIPDWGTLERSLYGMDISRQTIRIALVNLMIRGICNSRVIHADTLSETGGLREDDLSRKYSVVITHPPFGRFLKKEPIRRDLTTKRSIFESLFLEMTMDALALGGRCAILVPESLLNGALKVQQELLQRLVESYNVLAVISLPHSVFQTHIRLKSFVIVFQRPIEEVKCDQVSNVTKHVWFYDVRTDGYSYHTGKGNQRHETPEINDIPDLLIQWADYKNSGFEVPPGPESGTLLDSVSEGSQCWWASVETIRENSYNLTAARYKPHVIEVAAKTDPVTLIQETLEIENEITNDLAKLLSQLKSNL